MTEYWQDKRINQKHVACAWALVVVMLAAMLVVTRLAGPACPQERGVVADDCTYGQIMRKLAAERQPWERRP
jgi:hypothetical protein